MDTGEMHCHNAIRKYVLTNTLDPQISRWTIIKTHFCSQHTDDAILFLIMVRMEVICKEILVSPVPIPN